MYKILVTGFSGFVSKHLLDHLDGRGMKSEVLGIDLNCPEYPYDHLEQLAVKFEKVDLLNFVKLRNAIHYFQPNHIIHLASYSSVGLSWKNPSLSFKNNMNIFLNLMEAVRELNLKCRVLSVGSSEEYGNVNEDKLPLGEECPLDPVSPYAVARVAQEQLSKVYCDGYGLDVVMTRSFNHIGVGQKEIFVIASFVKQLVEIKKGIKKERKLVVGDISIVRDFLDVRDVVDAYLRLLIHGEKGQVYNVCSGEGVSLREVIDIICGILGIRVEIEVDPSRVRPSDNKVIVGSNEKLKRTMGWNPKISLEESLKDIINYWSIAETGSLENGPHCA